MDELKKYEDLSEIAKAIAHPVRLYIINFLKEQSCCYTGKLTENLPFSQGTISQHLKVLKDAGLIKGQIETPKIKYCLDAKRWKHAESLFTELFKDFIERELCETN